MFANQGLGLRRKKFRISKIAPGNAGLLWYHFRNKKGSREELGVKGY